MRVESTTRTSQSRCPVTPTAVVCWRTRSTAASSLVTSRTRNDSWPPLVEMSPMSILGLPRRISVRITSSIFWRLCLERSAVSASSSR